MLRANDRHTIYGPSGGMSNEIGEWGNDDADVRDRRRCYALSSLERLLDRFNGWVRVEIIFD